jgi:hypothetical protein
MGWRAAWDTASSTIYTDAGTTVAANGEAAYRMSEFLGVVANSYFDQATALNRPTYRTGGAGGQAYLDFDGSASFMESLAISNFFANNAKSLILACTVNTGWAASDYLTGVSTGDRLQIIVKAGNVLGFQNYDGSTDETNTLSFVDGTPLVISCKHDTGRIYCRQGGGVWGAGIASGNTTALTALWRIASRATNYAPMHFYGMCVSNTVVSDPYFEMVENYYLDMLGLA